MRYRVKELLRVRYKLTDHEIDMALLGKSNMLREAYLAQISPEPVANLIYNEAKQEGIV